MSGRDGTEEAARDNMEMRAEPGEAKALLESVPEDVGPALWLRWPGALA